MFLKWRGVENIRTVSIDENTFFVAELYSKLRFKQHPERNAYYLCKVDPDDANKLYVISADCHAIEPRDWMTGYIADDIREQLRARRARRDKEMDQERAEGVREPKEKPKSDEDKTEDAVAALETEEDKMEEKPKAENKKEPQKRKRRTESSLIRKS